MDAPRQAGRGGRKGGVLTHPVVVVAVVVIVVVAALAGSEAIVRAALRSRVTALVHPVLSGPLAVDLGPSPALLDVVRRGAREVHVHAPDTAVCGLSGLDVRATASAAHLDGDAIDVKHLTVRVQAPERSLASAVDQLTGTTGATVRSDPAHGQLVVQLGPGGAVQVRESVALAGTSVRLSPASTSVAGSTGLGGLITGLLGGAGSALGGRLEATVALDRLPAGLRPQSVTVVPDGVRLDLAGGPTSIPTSGLSVDPGACGTTAS